MNARFLFFQRWLLAVSVIFAIQGIVWVVLGSFDPFGLWDQFAFQTFFDGRVHEDVVVFRRFVMVPFGATLTGYFLLVIGITWFGIPSGQRWTYWTVVCAVVAWFVIDTTMSIVRGGFFNVWLVNVPCITLLGIPLVGLYPMFSGTQSPSRRDSSPKEST